MALATRKPPAHRATPAMAACAFEIVVPDPAANEIQLFPDGHFRGVDGRPANAADWVMDAAIAARLIEQIDARTNPLVIDYEHQTLNAEGNGQPAPAAGFFKRLEYRPGRGLFAVGVEWTERAKAYIAAGEYRFISPVFSYRPGTGEILALYSSALTNDPGLDGMAAIRAAARRSHPFTDSEEDIVDPKILELLDLDEGAEEAAVIAALKALKQKADDAVAQASAKDEQIAALKQAQSDPATHVPVAVVENLKSEIAALRQSHTDREIDELVTAALADGRLLAAQEDWARKLGTSDLEALKTYVHSAQPIAALKGRQTAGRTPEPQDGALTDEQQAICKRLGIAEDDYKAA